MTRAEIIEFLISQTPGNPKTKTPKYLDRALWETDHLDEVDRAQALVEYLKENQS